MQQKVRKPRTPRVLGPIESRIKGGKTTAEIMSELNIKGKATLQKKYLDELVDAGKAKPLDTGRGKEAAGLKDTAKIGKRGTLTVPSDMTTHFGFSPGDSFKISQRGDRIILAKQ